MIFCDKHFEVEFLKVERWVKFIGIPFFTIMSTLYLGDDPGKKSFVGFLFHFCFSFLGVLSIWYSTRFISNFFRKKCFKLVFALRLALQILSSCLVAVCITFVLHYTGNTVFDICCYQGGHEYINLKNLMLTVVLLTFLINTIYESFYLFHRLSETVMETERYKKESIEAQYQNLTSRLNPHFLFNSLNTLTTIVEEDPKRAVSYIQELAIVYRYVLNSQKSTWTDLPSEIKFTQSYINLLKMRFEDNLKVDLDVCDKHNQYYILPLTIQLLIENAVKHNEISTTRPLEIRIECTDDFLIVINNKQIRNIMPSTTKVGLQNIRERYKFLVDKEVIIEERDNAFVVKIPLVKTVKDMGLQQNESNGY